MYTAVNLGAVTAPHKKAQEDLPIVDLVIEPHVIANFLSCVAGLPFPDGSQSPIHLQDAEMSVVMGNFPPGSDGSSIPSKVFSRLGSEDYTINTGLVGHNVKSLKARLWQGIVPLSEQRWREKGLHLPDNFDYAIQHLTAVLMVFEHLNHPKKRIALRDAFNSIHGMWAELDVELNGQRAERGEDSISIARLWTTYMTASFEVMAQRAHSWVLERAQELRAPLMEQLRTYVPPNENLQRHMRRPDPTQWLISDRIHMLHETIVKADYSIMTLMDEGFIGYTRPPAGSGPASFYLADCSPRGAAYAQRMKSLSHQIMFERMVGIVSLHSSSQTSGESLYESTMDQVTALEQVREELRGPTVKPPPKEPWILGSLARRRSAQEADSPIRALGFVVYRLTYGQTDAEWAAFVKKLEAHMNNWGGWQTGNDLIKPHLSLIWKDGKQLGLPEDDVNAAKAHFIDNEKDQGNPNLLRSSAFLVIDSASYSSYMTSSYTAATPLVLAGDSTGFVLAVEPDFDPAIGPARPLESPGYNGQVRVLGSLVWGDLFPLLESQCLRLERIWPLAIDHPNHVYTGPTVPLQVFNWRTQNAARSIFLRGIFDHAKRKMGIPVTPQPASQPRNPAFATVLPEVPRNTGTVWRAEQPPLHRVAQDPRLDDFENYLRDHSRSELAERVAGMRRQFNEPTPDVSQFVQAMGQFEQDRQPDTFSGQPPAADDPLRDIMLSEFQQYLLRHNQQAHAETVERMRRAPSLQNPYPEGMMERVRNFGQLLEERRRARSRAEEEESTEDESQDPSQ